jgi:FemAB-related protein (PEP-CTERM system-associated)
MNHPALRLLGSDTAERRRWDAFVQQAPDATFFHRSGWQSVIETAFGHRTWFYYVEQDGGIRAILPVAEIRSRLFGHDLVSLPFCVYGGVAGSCRASRRVLIEAVQSLASRIGARHLELRHSAPASESAGWAQKDLYYTFRKPIGADNDANFAAIPRKQRAVLRKSFSFGLQSCVEDCTQRFFQAYSASVHHLGTPVFAPRYFQLLKNEFGDDCEIRVISHQRKTLAAVLSFYFRNEVLPYYGGGTTAARECGANDFMYWSLMQAAVERGCTSFDFGRSKAGTGAFCFKKNWGFSPAALPYAWWLNGGTEVPDLNPLNPRYRLAIRAWRSMPLSLANVIGPHIARNLG